ncbi:MAG: DUF6268 family outer membrane beta-barrel protein [Puniceicoccales bacterium]|jgi:hypothetical protein|nr:DUF6268 family outer membrane beta-barrel protein [Puniceicoccales bacterium]
MKFRCFVFFLTSVSSFCFAPPFLIGAATGAGHRTGADSDSKSVANKAVVASSPPEAPAVPPSFRAVAGYSLFRTTSDLLRSDGQVSSQAYGAEVSFFAASRGHIFFGEFGYEKTDYRFRGVAAPFDGCEQLKLSFFYEHALTSKWAVLALASGALAAEQGSDFGDGATGRIGGGVKYAISKDLNFSVGVGVANRLSDDPSWFPYAGLTWRISPNWSLRSAAGLTLVYDVFADHTLRFELSGGYRMSGFRLKNVSADEERRKRAIEIREGEVRLGVIKEFFKRSAYIRADVGGNFSNTYKFHGSGGGNDFRSDSAAVFRIEAGVRF